MRVSKPYEWQQGQRTFVGAGEQSLGTVVRHDYYGVHVKLDSDGVIVQCHPDMLSRDGEVLAGDELARFLDEPDVRGYLAECTFGE